jgi:hypothetical protein
MSQSTTRGSRLSRPLSVLGLVGYYPTNYLIEIHPIRRQKDYSFFFDFYSLRINSYGGLRPVSQNYPPPRSKLVYYY